MEPLVGTQGTYRLRGTPLKNTAVENLSREDSTLMSADTILEFMLNKLSNFNNDISTKLFQN